MYRIEKLSIKYICFHNKMEKFTSFSNLYSGKNGFLTHIHLFIVTPKALEATDRP